MSNEQVEMICVGCLSTFYRDRQYMDQVHRRDPLYLWRRTRCDSCVDKRADKALMALPGIISSIIEVGK